MLLLKRVSKKFQKISCLCFILWFVGMIVPSSGYAMNANHHRKTVLKAFQLLDDPRLDLGWLKDWYEDHDVCFDCYPDPPPLVWDNPLWPQYGGVVESVMEAVAAETYNTDYYQDLAMCHEIALWPDECGDNIVAAYVVGLLGSGGLGLIHSQNLTSFLHFVDTTKTGEFNDTWDGYSCASANDIEYEVQDIPAHPDEYVDSMTCDFLGSEDGPGLWDPEGYLDLDPDQSKALYRYITPSGEGSLCEQVKARFCRQHCDEGCGSADGLWIEDVDFLPVSNLARYWYRQWTDTENPLFLGPVLHAATDATVPHHASGYLGNWHRQFENNYAAVTFEGHFLGNLEPSNQRGEDIEQEAIDLALGWIQGPDQFVREIVEETAVATAGFMGDYYVSGVYDRNEYPRDDDYDFKEGDAEHLQAYAIGRAIQILYKAYVDIAGEDDPDLDGKPNSLDNCDSAYNPGQENSDDDSRGDACDNCPLESNLDQQDLDGDYVGDKCDLCKYDEYIGIIDEDTDGDEVGDSCDNCTCRHNPNQRDLDRDSVGDECDLDIDGDGVLNASDNCVYVSNSGQEDCDADGMGAACDLKCPSPDPCGIASGLIEWCAWAENIDHLKVFDECLPQFGIDRVTQVETSLPKGLPDPNAAPWDFPYAQYGEPDGMPQSYFCDENPFAIIRSQDNMTSWDISNPIKPVFLGAYDAGGAFMLERFQNLAVIGKNLPQTDLESDGSLFEFEISLRSLSTCDPGGYNPYRMSGGPMLDMDSFYPYLYVTSSASIQVLDLRDPTNPALIGSTPNALSLEKAKVHGAYLYLISQTKNQMEIYSVGAAPRRLSVFQTRTPAVDIEIQDNYVYLAAKQGIEVIDVKDPFRPVHVNWIPIITGDKDSKGRVHQNNNPRGQSSHVKFVEMPLPMYPKDLSVHPGGLFAVTGKSTLAYFDLSDPATPVLKTTYPQNQPISAISTMGDYTTVFVKGGNSKIYLNNMNYVTSGFLVSRALGNESTRVLSVEVDGLANLPENTYVNYYYSLNGGKNWSRTEAGRTISLGIPFPADQILFASVLGTGNVTLSPRVWETHIVYSTLDGQTSTASVPMSYAQGYDFTTLEQEFQEDMMLTIANGKADIARKVYDLPQVQDSTWNEAECTEIPETTAYLTNAAGELFSVDLAQGTSQLIASVDSASSAVAVDDFEATAYMVALSGKIFGINLKNPKPREITAGLSDPRGIILDSSQIIAYVAEAGSGEISRVNLLDGSVTTIASGFSEPTGLAINESETAVYVTEYATGGFSKINLSDGSVSLIASVGGRAAGLAINEEEDIAYISLDDVGGLIKVKLSDGSITRLISGLNRPRHIALNAAENTIYIAQYQNTDFLAYDLSTQELRIISRLAQGSLGVDLNLGTVCSRSQPSTPPTAYLVEQDPQNGLLTAVNLSDGTKTPIASGLAGPFDVVLNSAGTTAYVTEGNSTDLSSVDIASGVTQTITSSVNSPYGVALDNNEGTAYVTELYNGRLVTVEIGTGTVTEVVSGLSAPKEVELDPSGAFVYVVEAGSDELSKVDIARKIITVVTSGIPSPRGLAINADGTTAYVTDGTSGGNLWAVDTVSGAKTIVATGLVYPEGVTLNEAETTAYVTSGFTGQLMSVDIASGTVTTIASGLMAPRGVDVRE